MALLQKIRNRAGLLIAIVIGLALVAFILGDFVGQGGAMFNRDRFVIAEVAGKEINYQEFEQKVDYLIQISTMFSQEQRMDEEQIEQTRSQAWEQMIRSYVLEDEYETLGLEVNAEEVFDMVQGRNIHPIVRQLFTNPQTGQVNPSNVIRFLKNMDQQQRAYWLFLEQEMIKERKFTKFNNLISKGLFSPEPIASLEAQEAAKSVDFRFVSRQISQVPDTAIEITEKDLKDYYQNNQENYKQEETTVDLEYVLFEVNPSVEDDLRAREWINQIKPEFAEEEENIEFVNLNSDVPYQDINYNDGELSDTINDFMFSADIGELYGPYYENESYKIAKLHDINYLPDSVRVRHILLQGGQTPEANQAADRRADSLLNLLNEGEADFATLAEEHSADQQSAVEEGDLGWVEEGAMVSAMNDTCFNAEIGEIKKVYSQYGVHIVEVLERSREVKHVNVAILERKVTPSSETYQEYYSTASEFAGTNRTYQQFVQAANSQGLEKKMANNVRINDKEIPGFQQSPRQMIRWAFETEPRSVSSVFEVGDNYVVATVAEKREEGYQPLESVKTLVRSAVIKEKKSETLASQMNELIQEVNTLEGVANQLGTEVNTATNINFSSYVVPGAGVEPKLVAAATSLPQNTIPEAIEGNNAVYLLEVTSNTEPESVNVAQHQAQRISRYQQRSNYEVYETLKDLANIQDYRYKFY